MKANYPVEYMAAVLSADAGDTEKIATFVAECERMNIPVLPPDINESGTTFTVVDAGKSIRFGLSSIKNFGEGISEAIIKEREERGPFTSLSEFLTRVDSRNLNKKSLESLIRCGAMDRFGERAHLLEHLDTLLTFHREASAPASQDTLFASAPPVLTLPEEGDAMTLKEKLASEKELLGIYVSGHPLDAHKDTSGKASTSLGAIRKEPSPGLSIIIPALIAEAKTILTKNGEKMAFLKLEDKTGTMEAVVFPKIYKEFGELLVGGVCVLLKGTVNNRNGELSIAIDKVKKL